MSITVYKTKGGTFRYRVEVEVGRGLDGKPDRRTKVCSSQREAKRIEHEFEALKLKFRGRSDRMSFRDFVERYYLPMKRKALRKTTLRTYESTIKNHLMPTLSDIELGNINRLMVQTLLSSRATYKVAKDTRDMLRQILGEAMQMDAIQSNPAAGRFRLPDKKETDRNCHGEWVTSISEQQRIITLADDTLRPVLVLGFCFGLRKSEILGLDWQDIDFAAKSITVRRAYTYAGGQPILAAPKTTSSTRTIPASDYALAELGKLAGGTPRIGAVCICNGHRMTPYDALRATKRFAGSCNVPAITCHSLRHSFATAAIRSGMPVDLLSKMLGHTNITTTYNRYVKPLQSDLMDAVEVLNRANEVAKKQA